MPQFAFQAKNEEGALVSGMVEAENESAALALIKDENYTPVSIEERATGLFQKDLDFLQRVKIKDLVIMSRQLAVMMDATLPLVDALRILIKQTSNPKLQKIIAEIANDVEGGSRLSLALSKHPKQFGDFYISIVRSGETSGQLAEVLNYLADQLEKDYDLKSKIRGAMFYPAFIISAMVVVGTIMMIFVVPRMTDILVEAGVALPWTTRLLIATSHALGKWWWLILIVLIGGFVGARYALRQPKPRYYFDLVKLYIPVFGGLFRRIAVVRMTQSLATLSAGKVPLTEALEIVRDVVGNAVYRDLVDRTIQEVRDGNSIASVFIQSKQVPNMMSQMLSVGEETGRLDDILNRLTNFYSREIDNLVRNLVILIEPIIMVVMGVAVGVMVAAIFLPIYALSTAG